MAVSERKRHTLYEVARGALGDEPAETLMEMLPPVGWADVATKQDLGELEARLELKLDARFAAVDARFAAVDARFAAVDARFDGLDARFDGLDARIEAAVNKGVLHLVFWLVPFFLAYGAALVQLS